MHRLALSPFLLLTLLLAGPDARAEVRAGGAPDPAALEVLRADGVRLVIDLRTPDEGIAEEAVAAARAGLRYVNLPVGREPAAASVIERVGELVDATDGDVLLHCRSGVRAGEVLARHLMARGAPREAALRAGREAGLTEAREAHVPVP